MSDQRSICIEVPTDTPQRGPGGRRMSSAGQPVSCRRWVASERKQSAGVNKNRACADQQAQHQSSCPCSAVSCSAVQCSNPFLFLLHPTLLTPCRTHSTSPVPHIIPESVPHIIPVAAQQAYLLQQNLRN